MRRAPGADTTALVAGGIGGVLLLVATFVPWSQQGAGSAISLRRVADLVLAGTVDAWVPRWAGLIVYCIPLGGALLLVGTGVGGRAGTGIAAGGVVVAVVGALLVLTALDSLDRSGVGAGTAAAAGGAMLGTLAVVAGWRARRDPPSISHTRRGDQR